jgi:hypothetical protein
MTVSSCWLFLRSDARAPLTLLSFQRGKSGGRPVDFSGMVCARDRSTCHHGDKRDGPWRARTPFAERSDTRASGRALGERDRAPPARGCEIAPRDRVPVSCGLPLSLAERVPAARGLPLSLAERVRPARGLPPSRGGRVPGAWASTPSREARVPEARALAPSLEARVAAARARVRRRGRANPCPPLTNEPPTTGGRLRVEAALNREGSPLLDGIEHEALALRG